MGMRVETVDVKAVEGFARFLPNSKRGAQRPAGAMDRHLPTISRSVGIAMLHYEDTSETYIVYQHQQHQQPVETQPATGDVVGIGHGTHSSALTALDICVRTCNPKHVRLRASHPPTLPPVNSISR